MRLGYEGEEKPGTKLCRALETRRESSAKYAQDLEGKFSVFESKGVCGAVLPVTVILGDLSLFLPGSISFLSNFLSPAQLRRGSDRAA